MCNLEIFSHTDPLLNFHILMKNQYTIKMNTKCERMRIIEIAIVKKMMIVIVVERRKLKMKNLKFRNQLIWKKINGNILIASKNFVTKRLLKSIRNNGKKEGNKDWTSNNGIQSPHTDNLWSTLIFREDWEDLW